MSVSGINYFMAKDSRTTHANYIKRVVDNKIIIYTEDKKRVVEVVGDTMYVYPTVYNKNFVCWATQNNYKVKEKKYDT